MDNARLLAHAPSRPLASLCALSLAAGLLAAPGLASAQTITIKPAAPAASAPGAPPLVPANAPKETAAEAAERAKRQAEGPMYWIRINAQKAAAEEKERAAAAAAKPGTAPAPAKPAAVAASPAPDVGVNPSRVPASVVRAADQAVPLATSAAPTTTAGGGASAAPAEAPKPDPAPVQLASVAPTPAAPLTPPPAAPAPAPALEPEALVMVSGSEPKFPESLMRRLRRGSVQMRVDVGTDGLVSKVTVLSSSNPRLEQAAQEAAQAMRFQPTRAPASAEVNFSFDLDS